MSLITYATDYAGVLSRCKTFITFGAKPLCNRVCHFRRIFAGPLSLLAQNLVVKSCTVYVQRNVTSAAIQGVRTYHFRYSTTLDCDVTSAAKGVYVHDFRYSITLSCDVTSGAKGPGYTTLKLPFTANLRLPVSLPTSTVLFLFSINAV